MGKQVREFCSKCFPLYGQVTSLTKYVKRRQTKNRRWSSTVWNAGKKKTKTETNKQTNKQKGREISCHLGKSNITLHNILRLSLPTKHPNATLLNHILQRRNFAWIIFKDSVRTAQQILRVVYKEIITPVFQRTTPPPSRGRWDITLQRISARWCRWTLLGYLTLENGTDSLSRMVGT
jgi:hypothetical protein